jgi:8-amino-7-oxononanoate synthase
MEKIKKIVKFLEENKLYPNLRIVSGPAIPETIVDGKKVISFCSNNYLGLSFSEKVKKANIDAILKYGTGAGGSRLLSGNLDIHVKLEEAIADFKQTEDAIIFTAGYMTNLGFISAVFDLMKFPPYLEENGDGVVFSDRLNHASIIDSCRFSKAKIVVYEHLDMVNLEGKLREYKETRKMIVTDGVFSMDGDITPLDKIVDLADTYKALVMVDDAHATGVLGKNGRGTLDHFNILHKENIMTMGTFSKSLGAAGGFIAGPKGLIKYLRVASRPYMFSAAMPPGTAAALIAAFEEIKDNPLLRKTLLENANYFRNGMNKLGYDTLNSQTPIIPVLIGEEDKAIKTAEMLFEEGFFAPCVRWPAVEKNRAIIRFTVMSLHTQKQIDSLFETMKKIGKILEII